ncbi:N-succinylarginine dihydrolase [Photobacterium kishitanii]|uniref:N-succinylarginine dihydrolase n=1 Tax=Photobacterium kishitanii TaxID=318456 RepID=A0AAX0YX22_9GAMM|nr:N-succinylarginine dihydrolase [Photobacterium kishitanii]KJG09753.1 N-succinylarginine dihydrolase [Photobacterium kishitanii]KJG61473.1 N-succinylarginine dihydrolase [Photobacterium kishitanii]KJG66287.1 N-succinylarginine dihydrolase [Photobacterium kishitanii]KJG69631.1 N-succinylarginine dihydrolase [Photobacterium kishitanii]PSV07738.1 N-succinylarginine dihydrolase [Photobacterium kishitanii]
MIAYEANFDGLVGPTHNYSGLSTGNIASLTYSQQVSNPKRAALQGLDKMKALANLGLIQGVIAPQMRPDIQVLRRLGFYGSDRCVLQQAAQQAPKLLTSCCSASSMWAANAATVSPSADTDDRRIHFTPANLVNHFHRSIENQTTSRILAAIFNDENHFCHHQPLPASEQLGDEGAANHMRFCEHHGEQGVEMFVFGRYGFDHHQQAPTRYPARQTYEASAAIVRLHQLDPQQVVMAQQNPLLIDQGVFHNDVIAVANQQVLFCHQYAFLNQADVYLQLQQKMGMDFSIIEVPDNVVSVDDAVSSYLFNSQLVTLPNGDVSLILPQECQRNPRIWQYVQQLLQARVGINRIDLFNLSQSMCNGGGPACLRLRVVLTEQEQRAVNPAVLLTDTLFKRLREWIDLHYRDRLVEADLADPSLLLQSYTALDELTYILKLGSVYDFQQV